MAAVTNYRKGSALQQHKFMIFLFCRSEVQNQSHSAKIKVLERLRLRLWGRTHFPSFPDSSPPAFLRSCCPSAISKVNHCWASLHHLPSTLFLVYSCFPVEGFNDNFLSATQLSLYTQLQTMSWLICGAGHVTYLSYGFEVVQ